MQWAVDPMVRLADHVLAQIAAILCLMFPEHDDFQPPHMRKRRCAESLRQATNTTVVD